MGGVRFSRARLTYGCHDREFELPADDRPIVVAGGNGSGKSTLLEGLVRTLYGFNRRATVDGYTHEQREPWTGEPYGGRVEIRSPDGSGTAISRDFEAATVAVEWLDTGADPWKGDGNPAATNLQARAFRERLRDLFGLDNFDDYGRTAYVQQGELAGTKLGQHLLRAAAGGTIDVDAARAGIRKLHRELTRAPIDDGERGGNNARRREELEQRRERLRDELQQAELSERRREPLSEDRRAIESDVERVRGEIDDLEAAQQSLLDRQELAHKLPPLQDKIRRLEGLSQELGLAVGGLQNAVAARTIELGNRTPLPDDFLEHAAALSELWGHRERQRRRRDKHVAAHERIGVPGVWWPASGLLTATAGGVLLAVGKITFGTVAFAAGFLFGVATWLRRRAQRTRQDAQLEAIRDVDDEVAGLERAISERRVLVPDGAELTPDTVAVFRDRFDRQQRTRELADRAREALDDVSQRAAAATGEGRSTDVEDDRSTDALLGALGDQVSKMRNELVRCQRRLEDADERPLPLPAGVESDLGSVREALTNWRRLERERLDQLRDVERRLLEDGTPDSSPVALREALAVVENELTGVDETIAAYRIAWSLVGQAHVRFRDEDEQRLVAAVSRHLAELSEGQLGPLELTGSLDEATVRAFGRSVPLDYRPLSYGQYHLTLLAVRLGAADFLARSGVRVPLIIDEPFANLDDTNAALVWRQLREVATERQVIVATQESTLLERLGISPDIRL